MAKRITPAIYSAKSLTGSSNCAGSILAIPIPTSADCSSEIAPFTPRADAYTSDAHQPMLVVGCQNDEITHPESAVELSRSLSNGRLLMLEDSGHFAHYYDSSLAESIIQFIAQFKKEQEGVPA